MGRGIVIRNKERGLIASAVWSRRYVSNPMLAEILVLERAIELVEELGLQQVVFEGDALTVIKDVKE